MNIYLEIKCKDKVICMPTQFQKHQYNTLTVA